MGEDIALRLLGPVQVRSGPAWSSPGAPQRRLVLALLALRAGQAVPVTELVEAVWGETPPHSARASLQALMTRLRQALAGIPGGGPQRCGDGYRLTIAPALVDLHRFRSLTAAGRSERDDRAAIASFDEALACWRGPALADVPVTGRVTAIRAGLASEQLAAAGDRMGRLLHCGQAAQAAAELPGLLAGHPLAERLAGLLMVALSRCGERADALQVFRDTRARLAAELGVEPGPELQQLHRRLLAGDPDLLAGAPDLLGDATGAGPVPRPVPRQLPAGLPHFTGRRQELAALTGLAGAAPGAGCPPAIVVITGTAGVGKTALAVHWAQLAAGRFPDGQLYADLRGFGPGAGPVPPEQALCGFLRAAGVPPSRIPAALDEQAALYRSVLAGRQVLVVLDNARDEAQVRPLLPGGPGCQVVITSRRQLTGLAAAEGARLQSLDVMPGPDGCELLGARLGPRALAEPAAVRELAQACAGLPLALAIAAALAAARPARPLAALAAELRSGQRLDCLETGDAASSIREVFSWSIGQLSGPAARMFRLLGVHPGPDVSAQAAASVAGVTPAEAQRALAELSRAHLLAGTARFTCHDLLRAYAAELAAGNGAGRAALRRMLDHYLYTAVGAARLLYPARDSLPLAGPVPGARPERLTGRAEALAWFGTEYQVVTAAAARAAAAGLDRYAWQLAAALAEFLDRQGHWPELAAAQQVALAAAGRLADRPGQAHAQLGLGTARLRLGQYGEARAHLGSALRLFAEGGDRARQARARILLGVAAGSEGRYQEACRHTRQALRLHERLGHRAGQANALTNLGWQTARLGDYQQALAFCRLALRLHGEVGNVLGQAHTWDHVGYVRHCLGEHGSAVRCYQRALGLLGEVSDRQEEADVLTRLGDAEQAAGDHAAARAARQRAAAILEDLYGPATAGRS